MRKVKAIIPARLESHRLPRKLLLAETGKPLIQHTYEAVRQCSRLDDVLVATDSREIEEVVRGFGGQVVMTGEAKNGTERVYQATQILEEDPSTLIINVQGDEPGVKVDWLFPLTEEYFPNPDIITLAKPLPEKEKKDPSKVKVVFSASEGSALYFSRAPIPYKGDSWEHIGIYAYTVGKLKSYMKLVNRRLEKAEDLEQLRALDAGWDIMVLPVVESTSLSGIDTQEDYNRFVEWYKRQ